MNKEQVREKIIQIEFCNRCPHFIEPNHCFKLNKAIENNQFIGAIVKIPAWCPLPDAGYRLQPTLDVEKLTILTPQEILKAEDGFIEAAKAKNQELGKKFISGEITYPEYEKLSSMAWAGYYAHIAVAQLSHCKQQIKEMMEEK